MDERKVSPVDRTDGVVTGRAERAVDQNWLSGTLGFSSCRDKSKQNNMLTW